MGAQAVRLSNVDIDNALKNKDFEVLFQPIFDLGNGALARVETFVRWRHPKLGLLPPGAFISFFESQGRMSELTRYVLGNALGAYSAWRGPYAPGLSINLALSDLSDDAFTSHFTKLLRDMDFPADLVTLECPMPPVDMPLENAAAHFERLSGTGARLAIEVRGRANDLLRSLDPFPFDEIKTGGSAILRFARTVRGPGLSAIADLLDVAAKANAAITAVGVEDQASLSALKGLGFTAAQGNHLGKVGSLNDFRPHRINEVRSLLELEPLSSENLTAMFRTQAPTPQPSTAPVSETASSDTEDALIDRLNERVAQFSTPSEPSETDAAAVATKQENEKKAKAREKAKALILAKRAKARAARKAAAIERAKAKVEQKSALQVEANEPQTEQPVVAPPASAPRKLQERLTEEFNADTENTSAVPACSIETAQHDEAAETGSPIYVSNEEVNGPAPEAIEGQGTPLLVSLDDPAPQTQTPAQLQQLIATSLDVGNVGAYLQPGIRVGAAALVGKPDQQIPPSKLELPVSAPVDTPAPEQAPEMQSAPSENVTAANAMPVVKPLEATTQGEPVAPSENSDPETIGDLHEKDSDLETPTLDKPAQKNFLQRKYQVVPTHFWPRSWKRAMKRRAVAKAAERREDHDAAKENLAAE